MPEEIQKKTATGPIPNEAGPGVIQDPDELLVSLAEIRDHGYALGRQECMEGWNSIAAPVIWNDTIWGAALMLKTMDVMPEAPREYITATLTAATRLSQLGGS
ncbi:IclR family transcriptional regulator C-terminal domain-containing protein [Streptomyces rubradiris]|uniref:IclR family transcriptional regulator domain-containing protein n=1 Tax=Streptomyces rubradiris TaxID=285531 RepID=UPI0036E01B08